MNDLQKFQPWRGWAASGCGGALLPTPGSCEWFIRRNHQRLVSEGVLLPRRGPGGTLIDVERFPEVAVRIVRESAESR